MTTWYLTSARYEPPALLRRKHGVDEEFVNGAWRPTISISQWLDRHDDFLEEITEERALAFAPHAFTTPPGQP